MTAIAGNGPHVLRAMVAVKKIMAADGLPKDRSAPKEAGGYRFRGIDDLYSALCRVEAEESLLVFPRITSERTEYQEKNGKLQTHVHITMELKFVSAIDGSSEVASAIGEGIDTGDKASGKAQSNAMKQAHLEVYKIPTEGDNDIEASHEEVGRRAEPTLERQLSASLEWGQWEKAQAETLREAKTMGELQERWASTYETAQKAPNGMAKRLAAVKDERKKALGANP